MNVFRKILKNQKGFSILQAIIAAGALGVASVGVIKLSENQIEELLYLETKQEEEAFVKQVSNILLQEGACTQSFSSPTTIGGVNPTVIRSATNTPVFSTGTATSYGGGAFHFSSMNLVNVSVPTGGGSGIVRLDINIERRKRKNGVQNIRKSINLQVDADSSLAITRCNTDVSNLVADSLANICTSLDGLYNPATRLCDLSCSITSPGAGLSASCLRSRVTDNTISGYYDGKYVLKTGGSTSGNLTLAGASNLDVRELRAGTQVCIGPAGSERCRDLATSNCSAGQIVSAVNTDGSLVCRNITCASGEYFAGLDSSGNPICNKIPDDNCPSGQVATGIQPNGDLICETPLAPGVTSCPTGQYISSISSNGARTCTTDKFTNLGDCPNGEAVIAISNTGVATCAPVVELSAFNRGCPGADEFLRGFENDGTPICEGGSSTPPPPASFSCTSPPPTTETTICSDAGANLTADTAYTYNGSCSGDGSTCEYQCASGHTWDGSACVANSGFDCIPPTSYTWTGATDSGTPTSCFNLIGQGANTGQTVILAAESCTVGIDNPTSLGGGTVDFRCNSPGDFTITPEVCPCELGNGGF